MSHEGSDGSDPGTRIRRQGHRYSTWGENVAAGYRTANDVMRGWMNSPGQRANILNGRFTDIGIGLATSADGTRYWTMVLARPA
ncbi:MAG: CAP domain-containing protein [Acidimicrobiia bacterium]|nr:CAP domain-containing protein [Acidimicrobiia bacterium]MBA3802897.1 CAP domain-containing protein [Acidimicrobiia bacterium]